MSFDVTSSSPRLREYLFFFASSLDPQSVGANKRQKYRMLSKFSLCFSREYKAIWKDNLAVYHKSILGFFPGTPSYEVCLFCFSAAITDVVQI